MIRVAVYTLLFSVVRILSFAGDKMVYNLDRLNEEFPNERRICTDKMEHLHILFDGEKLTAKTLTSQDYLYIKDRVSGFEDDEIVFGSFQKVKKIKAYSMLPKGDGKFKKRKVRSFYESNTSTTGIFYDDQKKISFRYPNLDKGVKTHLQYEELLSDARFLGQYFLGWTSPVSQSEISVTFPNTVNLGVKEMNFRPQDSIRFSTEVKGKMITYKWTVKNLKPRKFFNNGPNPTYYFPHLVFHVKETNFKGEKKVWLPDEKGLYNWYYQWIKDVNQELDSSLSFIADSITNGLRLPSEKAQRIFNWVQDNIKYVAFEDGMGGYVPRQAALVCDRRYGDCKDMASIITAMLNSAGVNANLTWVGSDDLPYKYTEVPSPVVDNHMIASYRNENGSLVILDAVGTYTPYGMPTGFIQGKECLISHGKDSFEIARIPIVPAEKNLLKEAYTLKIEGSDLIGSGYLKAEGYSKIHFTYLLLNQTSTKRKERMEKMLKPDINNLELSKLGYQGLSNRDTCFYTDFKLKLPNQVKTVGNEVYVNLHFEKYMAKYHIDVEDRDDVPLKFDQTIAIDSEVRLELPQTYISTYLPEASSYNGKEFGYAISYERISDKVGKQIVVAKLKVYRNVLMIEPAQFEEWNKFVIALRKQYNESLVFKIK